MDFPNYCLMEIKIIKKKTKTKMKTKNVVKIWLGYACMQYALCVYMRCVVLQKTPYRFFICIENRKIQFISFFFIFTWHRFRPFYKIIFLSTFIQYARQPRVLFDSKWLAFWIWCWTTNTNFDHFHFITKTIINPISYNEPCVLK